MQVEIDALFQTCSRVHISPDVVLIREGEKLDYLYLVLSGQVEIVKALGTPDERLLGVRGAGTLLGEMCLFNADREHTASVFTLEELDALQMSYDQYESLVQRFPTLVYSLLSQTSQRLSNSENLTILDLREKNRQLSEAYYKLHQAQAQLVEKERLEHEMELARQIQLNILPNALPQSNTFEFGAAMFPARAVGGDFYDLIELGEGRIGIVLGDVSDKGVPAALIMAMTHTLVRVEASCNLSPFQVVSNVNQHLLHFCRGSMFVTLLYGILDCVSGLFHYVRAGHPTPILCSPPASIPHPLDYSQGQLLGMLDEIVLDEQRVLLSPGDAMMIYSDGLTEATNVQEQPLGEQGLMDVLNGLGTCRSTEVCDKIYKAVMSYITPFPQQDDITIISIRRSV